MVLPVRIELTTLGEVTSKLRDTTDRLPGFLSRFGKQYPMSVKGLWEWQDLNLRTHAQRPRQSRFSQQLHEYPRCRYSGVL
jgi:hypothetical protein